MQSANDISVIICTYTEKRWTDLVAAIESVRHQELAPREIIVVVDHNIELLKRIREQIPGVLVVANERKRGLSEARNRGIEVAGGPIIAFLDDDAIADAHWLQALSEAFLDPWVLGAGGSVVPDWVEERPSWLPEEFYWVVGCTYRGMPQSLAIIRNPIGANMAFRREVFEQVGGFRSEVGRVGTRPVGCEETELCIRVHQYWPQHVFLYKPEATVFHRVPPDRCTRHYFRTRCYAEGLSKAVVVGFVGSKESLSSERVYTLQTLPKGVLRGIGAVLKHGDWMGLARSWAIMAGLAITGTGYCVGRVFSRPEVPQDQTITWEKSIPLS